MLFKPLLEKYKDIIPYAFWGVVTTIENIFVYWLLSHKAGLPVMYSTVISWIVTIVTVYFTNRKWVFHSEAVGTKSILKEFVNFLVCRLGTGFLDWGCMFLFVDVLHFNDVLIKTLSNILVIVINYLASKFIIFRHSKN